MYSKGSISGCSGSLSSLSGSENPCFKQKREETKATDYENGHKIDDDDDSVKVGLSSGVLLVGSVFWFC